MSDELDFNSMRNCVCFNLRRVSRILAQFFVRELKHHDLLPTQTPILSALSTTHSASMAELSDWLGMDRTTLVRNLRPLERDDLVKSTGHGRGSKVSLELTPKGRAALERFLPDWRLTQQKIIKTLGKERWNEILRDLQRATLALN